MKFILIPTLGGLEITSNSEQLIYTNKLFSLSSDITNERGNTVASLRRTGWWHLTFSLSTNVGEYDLVGNWGEFYLLSRETSEKFVTNSSTEFYTPKGIRVTEFHRAKNFGPEYSLTINNPAHALAFIMASCIFYKTTIEG